VRTNVRYEMVALTPTSTFRRRLPKIRIALNVLKVFGSDWNGGLAMIPHSLALCRLPRSLPDDPSRYVQLRDASQLSKNELAHSWTWCQYVSTVGHLSAQDFSNYRLSRALVLPIPRHRHRRCARSRNSIRTSRIHLIGHLPTVGDNNELVLERSPRRQGNRTFPSWVLSCVAHCRKFNGIRSSP
jgi:hypothetical protein